METESGGRVPPFSDVVLFHNTDKGLFQRSLDFILFLGTSARIDCGKCKQFPLPQESLDFLKPLFQKINHVAIYNSSKITVKCWTEIIGFSNFYAMLKENKNLNITIFEPPRLALIVLETLNASYKLSTTKDGPYHVKTSA